MGNKLGFIITWTFIFMLLLLTGCLNEPKAISQSTPLSPNIEVTEIIDKNIITNEIIQTKSLNQCDSASSLRASIHFSQSDNQESTHELILGGKVGGEVGVSEIAKASIEGKIEQHFAESQGKSQSHQEGVEIEVPAHSQQKYTLTWRESRREGIVKYMEGAVEKSVDYSYRIGLELVNAAGQDLPCPGFQATATLSDDNTKSSTETPQVVPTFTSESTLDTAPGTVLQIGQTWTSGGISVRLARVDFEFGSQANLIFEFRNASGKSLFFHFNENTHVTMQDDTDKFYPWDHTYEQDVILEDGESYAEKVFKGGNFSGAKYFIITLDIPDVIYAQWRYN